MRGTASSLKGCGERKAEVLFPAFDLVINSLVFSCTPEPTSYSTYTTAVCRIISCMFSSACFLHTIHVNYRLAAGPAPPLHRPLCCCQNGGEHACTRLKQLFPIITSSFFPLRYWRDPRNDSCECWLALMMLRTFACASIRLSLGSFVCCPVCHRTRGTLSCSRMATPSDRCIGHAFRLQRRLQNGPCRKVGRANPGSSALLCLLSHGFP